MGGRGVGSQLLGQLESFATERAEPGLGVLLVLGLVSLVLGLVGRHEATGLHRAPPYSEVHLVFSPEVHLHQRPGVGLPRTGKGAEESGSFDTMQNTYFRCLPFSNGIFLCWYFPMLNIFGLFHFLTTN